MTNRTFTGFGFGAIQAGLFLYEAYRSGNFTRFVVAEVMQDVVDGVRNNDGRYWVNVATRKGIERHEVPGLEIYNPRLADGQKALIEAVAEASEICTALPSVKFYGSGETGDVVDILAAGLKRKTEKNGLPRAIVYTAENHNHAAEILEDLLKKHGGMNILGDRVQVLNTVIGKMSGVVTDAKQVAEQELRTIVPAIKRAFLVEEFNRILISRVKWPDFSRGIRAFEEKPDLLPFEEAKLYGHNATHALIGYLLRTKGAVYMAEAEKDKDLMKLAREAFMEESGKGLCRKYAGVDGLFAEKGYRSYADDLLERMMNPHLRDSVERVTRDPKRKLGWDDRLVGTMRMALSQGITPRRYATGAAAALRMQKESDSRPEREILNEIWGTAADSSRQEKKAVMDLILGSRT